MKRLRDMADSWLWGGYDIMQIRGYQGINKAVVLNIK